MCKCSISYLEKEDMSIETNGQAFRRLYLWLRGGSDDLGRQKQPPSGIWRRCRGSERDLRAVGLNMVFTL